eukprot:6407233-Pyramimonas_sp.AAC.1
MRVLWLHEREEGCVAQALLQLHNLLLFGETAAEHLGVAYIDNPKEENYEALRAFLCVFEIAQHLAH